MLENLKKGNPESEWNVAGSGDANIQGFATNISVDLGQTVDFKIATDSAHYRIDIYRLGYYGGDGARKVASIEKQLGAAQIQPHPIVDYSLGLIDAGNWAVSASWNVPADATSGVYIAKLVREDGTAGASLVPFIVRDDKASSDIVFQTSDTTWQAYNEWGGASLYFGEVPTNPADMIAYMPPTCGCGIQAIGRASAISYNRPIVTTTSVVGGPHDFIFGAEHSAIRWIEQNGYDVSYISGVDSARSGSMLLNHDAFLSVGHDEYWSAEQRSNVEAARDAGVNLAFWSGNEVYWKVRWETSIDGNGTPYRTMVCYKETWANANVDPSAVNTGTWRDPRFADPGQKPENALTGTMFTVDSYRSDAISVPYDYSNLRFWRNTDVAELQPGETATLVKNLLGYEWDSDVDNGFRPAGLVNMSLSTIAVDTYLYDYGNTVGPGTATHSLTMYRAESGALVFGAGTVFWSWGLDSNHTGAATPTDPNVQQAMVNMFADMGIQPQTLDASLVLATQTTDSVKPTSLITSPQLGTALVEGQKITITGTAQDGGGGLVAGIEVSTDGGQSWHKASGRETWSYNWIAQASGAYKIMSRAADDSLNLESPTSSVTVNVALPTTSSLFPFASKPTEETIYDRTPVELGVTFESDIAGFVTGVRFYKGPINARDHQVHLWSATGTLLATGTSTDETYTGWQTVKFASPVQIAANTKYIASYHTNGFYSATDQYFKTEYTNGPLSVAAGGGVYGYGSGNAVFPTSSYGNANYYVDVVFDGGTNHAPIAVADSGFTTAIDRALALSIATLVANDTDADKDRLTIASVANASHGTAALDIANGRVVFTPTAGYTGAAGFSYTVSDGRGGTSSTTVGLTVSPSAASSTLFTDLDVPTGPAQNDGRPLELGLKFTASGTGTVSGVRFYKTSGDTGPHTGSLWSATGTLLATVTFSNETGSGWQSATFSSPVRITAGTTYVASYHSTGVYSADANYFATSRTSGPLTAPSSAASGGNGLYSYSATSAFPTATYNSANYWVDVLYNSSSTVNGTPVANNDNGIAATRDTPLAIAASVLLANDNDPDGDALSVTSVQGATNGTVAFSGQTNTITFTPTAGYTGSAGFSYTIADGRGGTASASVALTVTAPAPGSTAVGLFAASAAPTGPVAEDPGPVELGVKFSASAAGTISGLRYYKSARDTGTHSATLWTTTGTKLATATFTNETASGWQTVTFAQPVTIAAGTTYVASYHSNGYYNSDTGYFGTPRTNGALTAATGGNGVYAYGATSTFPAASFANSNYWVDVLYNQGSTGTGPTNRPPVAANDGGFSTQRDAALTLAASSLLANDSDPDGNTLSITGASGGVNGAASYDTSTKTVRFAPTAGYTGAASFAYQISDGQGGTASATVSLTVNAPSTAQTLLGNATPSMVRVADPTPVELGMKFQADVAGSITGIRFYKGADNTGPHEAHLWTATGTLLATATFTNESASGWQSVDLGKAVSINPNTTYIVSYHTNGLYSASPNFFDADVTNGHLRALSSALSGGNGVYAYGASGVFPTDSYNKTNYYVDVAFQPQLAA